MRRFRRHSKVLIWLASIAAASTMATGAAMVVQAEDAACVVNGTPVTSTELKADPSLCPVKDAPTPPAPTTPTEPTAPTTPDTGTTAPDADPVTTDPAPGNDSEGSTTDPVTPDPVTNDDDATTTPPPTDPQPPTRDPQVNVDDPGVSDPDTGTLPDDGTDGATHPDNGDTNHGNNGGGGTKPPTTDKPKVIKPKPKRHVLARVKHARVTSGDEHANATDARMFREHFIPKGRIPELPTLSAKNAAAMTSGVKGSRTSWATVASIAWIESHWGDPTAGHFVGRELTAERWTKFGTDGDGDGKASRASLADTTATLAAVLDATRGSETRKLAHYFGGRAAGSKARRAVFLTDYYAALGADASVHGLEDKDTVVALQDRVLADKRVEIYDGGRADVAAGIIDPRLLVTLEFLANRNKSITVTCMTSGHNVFTTTGNMSLHSLGQAVDIGSIDGENVTGKMQRGGHTWHLLHDVLLLPESMQPAELISLWNLGGPSFALPDHNNHVHIGWKRDAA